MVLERLGAALREAETVGIPWEVDEGGPQRQACAEGAADHGRVAVRDRCDPAADLHRLPVAGDFGPRMAVRRFRVRAPNLPTSKTGRKSVVLGAPALAILAALPRLGVFVIAGDDPAKPRADSCSDLGARSPVALGSTDFAFTIFAIRSRPSARAPASVFQ